MKFELIHTTEYLLLIDGGSKIMENDYFICPTSIHNGNVVFRATKGTKIFVFVDATCYSRKDCKKVIGYKKLNEDVKELDLILLPNFSSPSIQTSSKQFSLDDIKKCIELAREGSYFSGYDNHCPEYEYDLTEEQIIQSLLTPLFPKKFEATMYPKYSRYDGWEEDDEIPVMTPMTGTNLKGEQEFIGTYEY